MIAKIGQLDHETIWLREIIKKQTDASRTYSHSGKFAKWSKKGEMGRK